jgi:FecR-like protein
MFRLIATAVFAMSLPLAAYANGVVQSMKGDVRAGPVGQTAATVAVNQRLTPGTAVVTGADAQVILRFDDGQQVVLNQNTEFRIVDFRYNQSDSKFDRTVFDLIKGALRMVSGAIGTRNREAVALRTPQVTIGVRGTDFMVALVNPAYVSVLQGALAVTNTAGTVAFGTGTIGSVANSAALASVIPASALPAAASAAFGNLSAAAGVVAGGAASGAGATAGAAATPSATAATAAAAAAAIAGAAASNRGSTSTTTHH